MKQIYVDLLNQAKQILLQGQEIVPMGFLFKEGELQEIVPLAFKDQEQKHEMLFTLGHAGYMLHMDTIGFLSDAAMRAVPPDTDTSDLTETPLTYPKSMRQECVILTILDPSTGKTDLYTLKYKEATDGTPVFEEPETMEGIQGGISDTLMNGCNRAKERFNV